ncbi:hypothetical protein QQ045_002351 [Rhodiola kirilowii]
MGGNHSDASPMFAFNEFQLQAGLSDGGFSGSPYTWSNNQSGVNRIWERLDRTLLNGLAMSEFPMLKLGGCVAPRPFGQLWSETEKIEVRFEKLELRSLWGYQSQASFLVAENRGPGGAASTRVA